MTNNITGGVRTVPKNPIRKLWPLPEEEVVRRQLVRDVMNRLDYDDLKQSMFHDRKRFSDSIILSGIAGVRTDALTPAADAILTKIEGILTEFKATEEKGTLRMKQIEISLAELGVRQDKRVC